MPGSAYTEFVKANYHKVTHLPTTKRFAALGALWAAAKESGAAPSPKAYKKYLKPAKKSSYYSGIVMDANPGYQHGFIGHCESHSPPCPAYCDRYQNTCRRKSAKALSSLLAELLENQ